MAGDSSKGFDDESSADQLLRLSGGQAGDDGEDDAAGADVPRAGHDGSSSNSSTVELDEVGGDSGRKLAAGASPTSVRPYVRSRTPTSAGRRSSTSASSAPSTGSAAKTVSNHLLIGVYISWFQ